MSCYPNYFVSPFILVRIECTAIFYYPYELNNDKHTQEIPNFFRQVKVVLTFVYYFITRVRKYVPLLSSHS